MNYGKFVISLDFELFWGVRDSRTISSYGSNIIGVHTVIPRMLDIFGKYNIKATFSTVGFLFFNSKEELLNGLPSLKPNYINRDLSPYHGHFEKVGENAEVDKFHFAPQLIQQIIQHPQHEVGTHTFSHYYCLEEGQNVDEFRADLEAAKHIAEKFKLQISSLVFPRNQFNDEYLKVCQEAGILCYRGNEHSWLYTAKSKDKESLFRRACRLVDAYVNISGHNCYSDEYLKSKMPIDIPASRFLRPYSKKLSILDGLRLNRIKSGMTHAAKNNLTYHLWWHPHNFGANHDENFAFLKNILKHFQFLQKTYNFQSQTMTELAKNIINL
ncbi:MAG: polysaccharide deacetylase family protein [Saprospiraceae bacterium]|nr:polysaccharide deacetylase family protein [Saprospiraceae bacterium]